MNHHICYVPEIYISIPYSEHQKFHHHLLGDNSQRHKVRKHILNLIVEWVALSWILAKTPPSNNPNRMRIWQRIDTIKTRAIPECLKPYHCTITPAYILPTGLQIIVKRNGTTIHHRFRRLRNLQNNPKCEGKL